MKEQGKQKWEILGDETEEKSHCPKNKLQEGVPL